MIAENLEKTIRDTLFEVCHIWSWTFSYEFERQLPTGLSRMLKKLAEAL